MPETRSGRKIDDTSATDTSAGTKRKVDPAKPSTTAKKEPEPKKQKALEDVIPQTDDANGNVKAKSGGDEAQGDDSHSKAAGDAIEEDSGREKNVPSSILEKGVIYFFARPRVGIEDPESVGDLARTFFVLRPLPHGAKLGEGSIPDEKVSRLFALPKKTLPKRNTDRFMAFVEKAKTSVEELKEDFMKGENYETKTAGSRTVAPPTPIGEGVYAITHDEGRSTHLAYMLTIPNEIGEVQQELGLRSQGSFVMSLKNPQRPGPASTRLPQGPDFPQEIIEEMRGLAWVEVRPSWLDYPNAQILLIGEGDEQDLRRATEPTSKDQRNDKEEPQEELEKLEHEDELRVQHLHGDNTVFDDLKISSQEYPKIQTTW